MTLSLKHKIKFKYHVTWRRIYCEIQYLGVGEHFFEFGKKHCWNQEFRLLTYGYMYVCSITWKESFNELRAAVPKISTNIPPKSHFNDNPFKQDFIRCSYGNEVRACVSTIWSYGNNGFISVFSTMLFQCSPAWCCAPARPPRWWGARQSPALRRRPRPAAADRARPWRARPSPGPAPCRSTRGSSRSLARNAPMTSNLGRSWEKDLFQR